MKLRKWDEALRQAIAYQLAADWAWVAMPLSSVFKAYHQRWRFEAERVGLLAIDERGGVRAPIPAGPSPRLLPFLPQPVVPASGTMSGCTASSNQLPSGWRLFLRILRAGPSRRSSANPSWVITSSPTRTS